MSHLVEARDPLQPGRRSVLRPLPVQLRALLLDRRVRQVRGAAHAEALQQRLVGKGALEVRARVLDEPVEEDEGADLAVDVAVLELLADGAGGLGRARGLQLDDVDEVGDAAEVLLAEGLRGEVLDSDGDRRVGFLLERLSARKAAWCPARHVNLLGEQSQPRIPPSELHRVHRPVGPSSGFHTCENMLGSEAAPVAHHLKAGALVRPFSA